jgi:hypothetical protein
MRQAKPILFRYGSRLLLAMLHAMTSCCVLSAACYRTPQAALDAAFTNHIPSNTNGIGYKVLRIDRDLLLRGRWAVITRCDHPEWSAQALPIVSSNFPDLPEAYTSIVPSVIVMHAGDRIHLWRREALLQIEISAVAEENGSLGKPVRVRFSGGSQNDPTMREECSGVVRSPSDVEMEP